MNTYATTMLMNPVRTMFLVLMKIAMSTKRSNSNQVQLPRKLFSKVYLKTFQMLVFVVRYEVIFSIFPPYFRVKPLKNSIPDTTIMIVQRIFSPVMNALGKTPGNNDSKKYPVGFNA